MPGTKELFGNQDVLKLEENILDKEQFELLKWMKKTEEKFQIKYVNIKSEDIQKHFKDLPSYVKPNHIYEITYKETFIYDQEVKTHGTLTGFHGSSMENWYSILHNSLQNYSNTKKMKNGNVFGDGVYFCEDLRVANDFLVPGNAWKKSEILGSTLGCVCLSEIVKHPSVIVSKENIGLSKSSVKNSYIIVPNSSHIRMKYIMIYTHVKDQKKQVQSDLKSYYLIIFYVIVLIVLFSYKTIDFHQLKRNLTKFFKK